MTPRRTRRWATDWATPEADLSWRSEFRPQRIDLPGDLFAEYTGKLCCWCLDAPPDSREHRFKRSDLVQQFGRGPYLGSDETVVSTNDGKLVPVQGPRSSELKFRPNLCRRCNGARSQPFDKAWATFTAYVAANEEMILDTPRRCA